MTNLVTMSNTAIEFEGIYLKHHKLIIPLKLASHILIIGWLTPRHCTTSPFNNLGTHSKFNGNAKSWVKASKGLRQEDPLSLFLFTLVVDVLSRLMIRAEETGLTEGFFVGRDRTRVSLLQFGDETIFFSKASLEHVQNLKIILLAFGQVSGLKINLEKSTILGINTRQELLPSLALIFYCRVSEWPFSYLGLPLGENPKTIGF